VSKHQAQRTGPALTERSEWAEFFRIAVPLGVAQFGLVAVLLGWDGTKQLFHTALSLITPW